MIVEYDIPVSQVLISSPEMSFDVNWLDTVVGLAFGCAAVFICFLAVESSVQSGNHVDAGRVHAVRNPYFLDGAQKERWWSARINFVVRCKCLGESSMKWTSCFGT